MDSICLDDVKALIQKEGGVRVSIFMPTHHAGGENPQDPIRLRNLMRQAEEKLVARGLRSAEVRTLLAPAESLYTDNLFWRQQGDGLALFIESKTFFYYRLPLHMIDEVGIGTRFYIKSLVSLISECGWFYVLSLSRHENRLLQCTATGSIRVNLGDIPKNMPDSLHYVTPEDRMQFHVAPQVGGSNFGTTTAIQTGEGSRPNYDKRNIMQYFEQVSKGISRILKDEKAPMVLSAVDYLHPLYQSANNYRNLLPEGILGNPDGASDDTLREQAWTIVRPYFNKLERDAVGEFNKSAGTGLTAIGLEEVVPAARSGRIRFLFVSEGSQQWGIYDESTNKVEIHPQTKSGDDNLIDLAVYYAINHSGSIFVMKPDKMPAGSQVSAVLRF
jgi:hypothetical protein